MLEGAQVKQATVPCDSVMTVHKMGALQQAESRRDVKRAFSLAGEMIITIG